jgi:hypothetical protein
MILAQTDIVKEGNRDLGRDEPVRKRTNLGGVPRTDEERICAIFHFHLPSNLEEETIVAYCLVVGRGDR